MKLNSINNLYADKTILQFKRCYALEKLDGTATSVNWKDKVLTFDSGGASKHAFEALFNKEELEAKLSYLPDLVIYGEAYGGSQQKQAWRYGPNLKFCAFDVFVDGKFLPVPGAKELVTQLGLEFVLYWEIDTTIEELDKARDQPSWQANHNGVEGHKPMEGIIAKPLLEFKDQWGQRVIVKHKRAEERETTSPRDASATDLKVLEDAEAIALEWVTEKRLEHVLQTIPGATVKDTGKVIKLMTEDILREGSKEVVDSKSARASISKRTVDLFKKHLDSL